MCMSGGHEFVFVRPSDERVGIGMWWGWGGSNHQGRDTELAQGGRGTNTEAHQGPSPPETPPLPPTYIGRFVGCEKAVFFLARRRTHSRCVTERS